MLAMVSCATDTAPHSVINDAPQREEAYIQGELLVKFTPEVVSILEKEGLTRGSELTRGGMPTLDKILDIKLKDYTKCLVLRMRAVPAIDATAMNSLDQIRKKCEKQGVTLILSHVNPQPLDVMKKSGFYDKVGKDNFCAHIDDALSMAKSI